MRDYACRQQTQLRDIFSKECSKMNVLQRMFYNTTNALDARSLKK